MPPPIHPPDNRPANQPTFSFLVNGQIVESPFPVIVDPRTHEVRRVEQESPYQLPPVSQVLPPRWLPPDIMTFELSDAGAGQEIVDVTPAPEREAGEVIEDDGEGFQKIVEFLDGLKVI